MTKFDRIIFGRAAMTRVPPHVVIARYIAISLSATVLIAVVGLYILGELLNP